LRSWRNFNLLRFSIDCFDINFSAQNGINHRYLFFEMGIISLPSK
jgi:hypothetical protein